MKHRIISPGSPLIRRLDMGDLELKSVDEKTRTIWHPVTREVADRMGDIVRIDGGDISEFQKKPAVLYGHDYRSMNPVPIIGRNIGFEKVGDKLYAGTEFLPVDDPAMSQALKDLINDNWLLHVKKLLGWSIGFIPVKWDAMLEEGNLKGYDIKEWKLLEYSSVIIPANQDAVNDAMKNGLITGSIVKFFDLGASREDPQQDGTAVASTAAPASDTDIENQTTGKGEKNTMWEKIIEKLEKGLELTPEEKEFLKKLGLAIPQAAAPAPAPAPVRRLELTDGTLAGKTKHLSEIMSLPTRLLSEEERELRGLADDAYIVASILRIDPRQTKLWTSRAGLSSVLRKAMDAATSGEGSEWVPTGLSQDYIEKFRLQAKVAALFDDIAMPTNPYKLPYFGGLDASAFYLVGESTSDSPTASPATTPATGDQTLTAKKLKARVLFSDELSEDSIVPVLPVLRNDISKAGAEALEDCILNADTTATHMDSDVTDSKDRRRIWNGLRDQCPSGTKVSLSTFGITNLRSIITAMGKYGLNPADLALIVGAKGYNNLKGLTEVTTVDKYGPQATILSGELAKVDGISIITSEYIRENLNASGVYDGSTTTKSILIIVNRRGLILGTRGGVKLSFLTEAQVDQNQLIVSFRKAVAYRWTPSATVTTIGLGYNF